MFSADPLGIGLKTRARDYRARYETAGRENAQRNGQIVPWGQIGALPDPQWDGYFQAMRDQGVTKLADQSVGEARGMFGDKVQRGRQLNARHNPLQGFELAMPENSHDEFMDTAPAYVEQEFQRRRGQR